MSSSIESPILVGEVLSKESLRKHAWVLFNKASLKLRKIKKIKLADPGKYGYPPPMEFHLRGRKYFFTYGHVGLDKELIISGRVGDIEEHIGIQVNPNQVFISYLKVDWKVEKAYQVTNDREAVNKVSRFIEKI
jgi:hypothetical protein